jgi:predicted TIM-barrel fold metal-dependent hydrolase
VAELPFTDTHVHFHDFSEPALRWDWLLPGAGPDADIGDYSAIQARRYVPDDFLAETRFHNVDGVVHVQAAIGTEDPVEETRWLQALADRVGVPQGIVAPADLADPAVESLLERHADSGNLRGIRDLRYDNYLTDEAWLRGVAHVERHGLVLCDDPLLEHMPLLAGVARRFSDLSICVDHAGFPRRRDDEYFRKWRAGMEHLAQCENTVVKVSGLAMVDHRWTVDSLRPWVTTCLELWGPRRVVFGSNWPVDRLFSSYGDVIDAYAELVSQYTLEEQRDLLSGNAKRLFGLE